MNWKREVIDKLTGYEAHRNALASIPSEISLLESAFQGLKAQAPDTATIHANGASHEDLMLSNVVKREELNRQLKQAKLWVKIVDNGLKVLTAEQRKILTVMYIDRRKNGVEWLCQDLFCEKSTLYRKRDEALAQLVRALYGYEVC